MNLVRVENKTFTLHRADETALNFLGQEGTPWNVGDDITLTREQIQNDALLGLQVTCPACEGRGELVWIPSGKSPEYEQEATCPDCYGEGTLPALDAYHAPYGWHEAITRLLEK